MKKIIILLGILAVSFALLVSCADEPAETPVSPENTPAIEEVGTEAVDLYFSLDFDGFGAYLTAFPKEWLEGLQRTLEYTDDQFIEAIMNANETIDTRIADEYGDVDYYLEYDIIDAREIPEDEYKVLMDELSRYLYMSPATILDIKAQTYSVRTYGVDLEGYIVNEQFKETELYMLNIEGEGWKVSPHEYNLP